MRALRSSVALSFLALGAALIAVPMTSAQDSSATTPTEPPQNDLYPATLDFGTGLIDDPVTVLPADANRARTSPASENRQVYGVVGCEGRGKAADGVVGIHRSTELNVCH